MNYIPILITCMISYWIGGIQQKYIYDEHICDCSKYNLLEYIDNVNYDLIIENVKLKRDILYILNLTGDTHVGNTTYESRTDTLYEEIYNDYDKFVEEYYNFKSVFVESFRELLDSKRKLYNNCIKK